MAKTYNEAGVQISCAVMKPSILHELGITGWGNGGVRVFEDKGGIYYCDIIFLGPFRKIIYVNKRKIDEAPNPQMARFHNLKQEIKKWHKEISKMSEKIIGE